MASVIVALSLYCMASISLSLTTGRKASDCLTMVVFGSVAILYIFYIFDGLLFGFYFLMLLFFILFVSGTRWLYKNKKNSDKSILHHLITKITPSYLIFFIGCIATYWLVRSELVHLWDELRLWGAFPKILHYTHKLQMGEDVLSFVSMQSYPPFMPLFIYFLTSFSGEFWEYSIFWGYAIFCLSILIHLFDGLEWRSWAWIIPGTFISVMVPCVFYINGGDGAFFYRSLFIDSVLGIVIGYMFFQTMKRETMDKFDSIQFYLSLFVATAIKDSGVLFAAACSLLLLNRNMKKRRTTSALVALSSCLITFVSWKFVMSAYQITESIPISANEGFFVFENWRKLLLAFWYEPIFFVPRIGFIPCFVFLVLCDFVLDRYAKGDLPRFSFYSRCTLFTTFILFIIGYFALYPSSLASFRRYMGTLLTSYMVLLLFRMFGFILYKRHEISTIKKLLIPPKWLTIALQIIPVLLLLFFNYGLNKYRVFPVDTELAYQHGRRIVEEISNGEDEFSPLGPADVFLTTLTRKNDSVQLHHRIYFELIGLTANVKNFGYFDAEKYTGQDMYIELQSGKYEYFYLADDTLEPYGLMIGEKAIKRNVLYRIEKSTNNLQLSEVNKL